MGLSKELRLEKPSDVEEFRLKVVEINGGVFGSTGKIMFGIAKAAKKDGIEVMCASPITATNREQQPSEMYYKIGTYNGRRLNVALGTITGLNGCFAYGSTKKLLKEMTDFQPDVIHLHTLHNCYINLPLLFNYIKKNHIRTIWTLHDCWSFTGNCPHFVMVDCDKWKTGCYKCPQYKEYPASIYDNSKMMWRLKRKWFTGVEDLTIVTPSQWLAGLVKQSFLGEYPIRVINNGIDLDTFKPTKSDIRKRLGIESRGGGKKFVVLGVSFGWDNKKGLDVFIELAKCLDERFVIVLVGTTDEIDEKIPSNIISIHRTKDSKELAEFYSAADVLVNPTKQEVLGMVNIESLACGTPVIMFNTGGSPECIDDSCGIVVHQDINSLIESIVNTCEKRLSMRGNCVKRAKMFSFENMNKKYLNLYKGKLL